MLELTFFKRPFVRLNQQPVQGFVSEKVLGLFAYLVMQEGTHSREALATLLWSEMPDDRAKANLRQALHNLQKVLPDYLEVTRKTVTFKQDEPYHLDVAQFESAFQQVDIDSLSKATDLYQTDLLAGLVAESEAFESWLREQRETFRLKYLDMLSRLVQDDLQHQSWNKAEGRLRKILSIEPWHEEMHRQLMLVLARQRQYSKALAQYQMCKTILHDELGVEPMAETTAVFQRIESLRKRNLHNLPSQPTPFFGRQTEISQMKVDLMEPACRLLSIIGPGGIGKTRVSLELSSLVHTHFLEGAVFLPLSNFAPTDNLLSALIVQLTAVKLTSTPQSDQAASPFLIEQLKDKELLLVLDNAEHLLPQLEPIVDLLTHCPALKLIITSRERIQSRWERPFFLEGFSFDDESSEAGNFFIQTAKRLQPQFELSDESKKDVHKICQWVEGMPLGIELAASWLRIYSIAQIADKVMGQLDLLKGRSREQSRHQNLTAVLDQSWQLLSDNEQHILAALSAFRGGIPLTAAEKIAGADIEQLLSLSDKSLLRILPTQFDDPRFGIHELIRQYAESKLDGDPEHKSAVFYSHSQHFAQWLVDIEPHLKNAQQLETLKHIGLELNNIQIGWQRSIDTGETAVFLNAAKPLAIYFREQNLYSDGLNFFSLIPPNAPLTSITACFRLHQSRFLFAVKQTDEAIALIKQIKPILEKSNRHWETALAIRGLSLMSNNRDDVLAGLTQSLALFREAGDAYEVAVELLNLSSWSLPEEAAVYLAEAVEIYRSLGEQLDYSRALSFQGTLLGHHLGKFQQSQELIHKSLSIQADMNTEWRLLNSVTLGNMAMALGQLEEAESAYHEAAGLFDAIYQGNAPRPHYSLLYRTLLVHKQLNTIQPSELHHVYDTQIEANIANELIDVGYFHLYKSAAFSYLGQLDDALNQSQAAQTLFEEGQIWREQVESLCRAGWIYHRMEKPSEARQSFKKAIQISFAHQTRPLFFEAIVGMGVACFDEDKETAVSLLNLAIQSEATYHGVKEKAISLLTKHNVPFEVRSEDSWGEAVETAVAPFLNP